MSLERYNPYAFGHVEPVDILGRRMWKITQDGERMPDIINVLKAMGYKITDDGLWEYKGDIA